MVLLGKLAEGRFDDAALQMKHQVQVRLFLDSVVGERGRSSSSCLPAKSVVVGQVGFSLFLFYFDILNSVSELDLECDGLCPSRSSKRSASLPLLGLSALWPR